MKIGIFLPLLVFLSVGFLGACATRKVPSNKLQKQWAGQVAPSFHVNLIDGKTFDLNKITEERFVIINFFGTWCPPCRAEIPALYDLYRKNRDKVYLLGIALNIEERNVRRFFDQVDVNFPTALVGAEELGRGVPGKFEVPTVPTTVVISKDQRVIYYKPGMLQKRHFRQLSDLIRIP